MREARSTGHNLQKEKRELMNMGTSHLRYPLKRAPHAMARYPVGSGALEGIEQGIRGGSNGEDMLWWVKEEAQESRE